MQPRLADDISRLDFLLVPGITEARFPVPRLKVISKFAHLTAKPDIKENIVERGRSISVTSLEPAKANPGSHRRAIRQSCVRHRERIKGILQGHTNADPTIKGDAIRGLECIRRKWSRRP